LRVEGWVTDIALRGDEAILRIRDFSRAASGSPTGIT
jgi:hypothetical protein